MQPIRSGTTTERIVRATLLMVLLNGFAVAFLWDGYVRYARQNAEELVQSLGLAAEAIPNIDPALTEDEAERLTGRIEKGDDTAVVADLLGEPAIEHGGDTYYLGPGGRLRLRWDRGRVADVTWLAGSHNDMDLAMQRWLGYALGIIGLVYIIHFIRVVTTRASVTDEGLKLRGNLLIPFAAMTSLRRDRSGRAARVELGYSLDGRDQFLRLDDYVIKDLPAIVAAVCEKMGCPDPLASRGGDPAPGNTSRSLER